VEKGALIERAIPNGFGDRTIEISKDYHGPNKH
jgi:hypothetical protein